MIYPAVIYLPEQDKIQSYYFQDQPYRSQINFTPEYGTVRVVAQAGSVQELEHIMKSEAEYLLSEGRIESGRCPECGSTDIQVNQKWGTQFDGQEVDWYDCTCNSCGETWSDV